MLAALTRSKLEREKLYIKHVLYENMILSVATLKLRQTWQDLEDRYLQLANGVGIAAEAYSQ